MRSFQDSPLHGFRPVDPKKAGAIILPSIECYVRFILIQIIQSDWTIFSVKCVSSGIEGQNRPEPIREPRMALGIVVAGDIHPSVRNNGSGILSNIRVKPYRGHGRNGY